MDTPPADTWIRIYIIEDKGGKKIKVVSNRDDQPHRAKAGKHNWVHWSADKHSVSEWTVSFKFPQNGLDNPFKHQNGDTEFRGVTHQHKPQNHQPKDGDKLRGDNLAEDAEYEYMISCIASDGTKVDRDPIIVIDSTAPAVPDIDDFPDVPAERS